MKKVHPTDTTRMDPAYPLNQFRDVFGTAEFESQIGDKNAYVQGYQESAAPIARTCYYDPDRSG